MNVVDLETQFLILGFTPLPVRSVRLVGTTHLSKLIQVVRGDRGYWRFSLAVFLSICMTRSPRLHRSRLHWRSCRAAGLPERMLRYCFATVRSGFAKFDTRVRPGHRYLPGLDLFDHLAFGFELSTDFSHFEYRCPLRHRPKKVSLALTMPCLHPTMPFSALPSSVPSRSRNRVHRESKKKVSRSDAMPQSRGCLGYWLHTSTDA